MPKIRVCPICLPNASGWSVLFELCSSTHGTMENFLSAIWDDWNQLECLYKYNLLRQLQQYLIEPISEHVHPRTLLIKSFSLVQKVKNFRKQKFHTCWNMSCMIVYWFVEIIWVKFCFRQAVPVLHSWILMMLFTIHTIKSKKLITGSRVKYWHWLMYFTEIWNCQVLKGKRFLRCWATVAYARFSNILQWKSGICDHLYICVWR